MKHLVAITILAAYMGLCLIGCVTQKPPCRLITISFNRDKGESVTANVLNFEKKFTTNSIDVIRAFAMKEYNALTNTIVILNVINLE